MPTAPPRIPTDLDELVNLLRQTPSHQWYDLTEELKRQLGDATQARDLMDKASDHVSYERHIDGLRRDLTRHIDDAVTALHNANGALTALCSDEIYDVDYAEGGLTIADLQHQLDDAARCARMAKWLNPHPVNA